MIVVKRTVVCDGCGEQLDGRPSESVESIMRGSGWRTVGGKHLCEACRGSS